MKLPGERIAFFVGALALAGLGWLTWRYHTGADEMPWVFRAAAAVCALFGLLAPLRWLRVALSLNLFTQDLFRK